ncbi:glycosyltransferase [Ruegeria sp. HKCCD7255]|uniref:glycosyltransferase n=1 Tax=Ruegeria sp. HKCCD7255 TaxID=2683004 RepID=UPI001C2C8A8A|nr:glycosyltransferase [Ruegeria sp. HKCCD7255]
MTLQNPFNEPGPEELRAFYLDTAHFDHEFVAQKMGIPGAVGRAGILDRWMKAGASSKSDPNAYFDLKAYVSKWKTKPSHALHDFLVHGWRVCRDPSESLDICQFLFHTSTDSFAREAALSNLLSQSIRDKVAASDELSEQDRSLSVVTINYNNRNGLLRTIESVASQSDQNFEFVVVDGGSTDGSVELIKENQDRINIHVSERDNGIFDAMNKGARMSSREYVVFMNSGDAFFDDQAVDYVKSCLGYADIVYGHTCTMESDKIMPHKALMSTGMAFSHQAQYTRRDWLLHQPLDTTSPLSDWKFNAVAYLNGATYRALDRRLASVEPYGYSDENHLMRYLERRSIAQKLYPFSKTYNWFQGELERRNDLKKAIEEAEQLSQ